ncbi:MAG: OsmC family protein [Magnetococcales bacterium]|nr:OsmC family protein [Magnetococcales bacterium]
MKYNDVNIEEVKKLVGAVKENRGMGQVRFSATSTWGGGTKTNVTIGPLYANQQNVAAPDRRFTMVVSEPPPLGGRDEGANPVEYLLAGLCGCITAGLSTNGALFGVDFERIDLAIDFFQDVAGVFGLDDSISNGGQEIVIRIDAKAKGDPAQVQKVKDVIMNKSPVKITLEQGIRITSDLNIIT